MKLIPPYDIGIGMVLIKNGVPGPTVLETTWSQRHFMIRTETGWEKHNKQHPIWVQS